MAERLTVTPIEASVIFLNTIFGYGQHSAEVAKAFRSRDWAYQFEPEGDPRMLRPEPFLQAPLRSKLLLEAVHRALENLTPRQSSATKMRFGLHDGMIHTFQEIGDELGVRRGASQLLILTAFKRLRHPARRRPLEKSLSE